MVSYLDERQRSPRAGPTLASMHTMTAPTIPPADPVREAERADEAKTADSAPAPVHPPRERKVLVRDAYGRDPYGDDRIGPDGERDDAELGQSPYELPDPITADLQRAKASLEKT